jgi:hypothetical protein
VVVVVVVVTGTHGRVSTGAVEGGVVVVVVVVLVLVVVVVVVSGTVVVVVVVAGSLLGGGLPAFTACADRIIGATTSIVASTARAADEERRGVDIARSRRATRVAPTAPQTIGRVLPGLDDYESFFPRREHA